MINKPEKVDNKMKKSLAKNIQNFEGGCVNVMQKGQNKEEMFYDTTKKSGGARVQKCSFPANCRMCNKLV